MKVRWACFGGALAVVLSLTPVAHACSCAGGQDPRDTLEHADGAIIGRYEPDAVPQPPPSDSGQPVDRHFVVDEVIKGDIGDEVDVRSPYSGASCGLEVSPGEQVGLYLYMHNGHWTSSLCSQTSPDALRQASKPPPKPDGSGPPKFLMGGSMGPVRTLSIDAKGRTLRYAKGEGSTGSISLCPGSDVFAEMVHGVVEDKFWKLAIATRDVDTLALRDEHRFTTYETKNGTDSIAVSDIACLDPDGGTVAVYGELDNEVGKLVLVRGEDERVVFTGKVTVLRLHDDSAFYVQGRSLRKIDIRTGRIHDLATVPPGTQEMAVSPDAKHVVLSATGDGDREQRGHYVLDATTRRLQRLRTTLMGYTWVDDARFAVFDLKSRVRVFDVRLKKLAQWAPWGYGGVVRDGVLYTGSYGTVLSAPVLTGPRRTIRRFEFFQNFSFVVLPERPEPAVTSRPAATASPTVAPSSEPSAPARTPTRSAPPLAAPSDAQAPVSRGLAATAVVSVIAAALLAAAFALRRRPMGR